MQKTLKKSISILLSILMIAGIFTIVPITASAAATYTKDSEGIDDGITLVNPGDTIYTSDTSGSLLFYTDITCDYSNDGTNLGVIPCGNLWSDVDSFSINDNYMYICSSYGEPSTFIPDDGKVLKVSYRSDIDLWIIAAVDPSAIPQTPVFYTKDSEGIADGIILDSATDMICTVNTSRILVFDCDVQCDYNNEGTSVFDIRKGDTWYDTSSFLINDNNDFLFINSGTSSKLTSGSGTPFKVSYDSSENKWHIIDGSEPVPVPDDLFVKVTSEDQVTEDNIGACTFSDAKEWVYDHWDEITNGVDDGDIDFDFVYVDSNDALGFTRTFGFYLNDISTKEMFKSNCNSSYVTELDSIKEFYSSDILYLCKVRDPEPATYTVTWKNGDTVLETDENVAEGTTPTYDGAAPAKEADAQNTYTFAAWDDGTTTYVLGVDDLPPVTGDVTYTAVFTADPITYTVTWKNWDGTDLEVDTNVAKNTPPTYDGETPVRPDDANNTYTFSAWDDGTTTYVLGVDDLPPVTGDVTYTAVYTGEPKKLFVGHSVSLGGDIGVNFFIDGKVAGVDTAETAVVKFAWDGGNYIEEVNLKDLTPDNDGLYKATVNVAAAQMAHKIEAVAYINGNMIYTSDLYSVQDYAEKVIAEPEKYEPEKPEQLKALAEAMLHYGGEAQTVFDSALYSHPDRADSHLDAPDYSGVTEDAIRAAINGEASDLNEVAAQLDAEFYASTLVYLSKSTLRIYFTPASKTVGAFDGMDFSGNKNRYYYYTEVEDIAAAELDDQQYFSVNGVNFNYSVLDYVIALLNNSKMNDVQKNLAKSLFLYNQAANDYFDGGSEPAPAVTSFTKVTNVNQITEDNIGECTFAEAKAWILANWDDIMDTVHDVDVAYFVGNDLKAIFLYPNDTSKQDFEQATSDEEVDVPGVDYVQSWITEYLDNVYICEKDS